MHTNQHLREQLGDDVSNDKPSKRGQALGQQRAGGDCSLVSLHQRRRTGLRQELSPWSAKGAAHSGQHAERRSNSATEPCCI